QRGDVFERLLAAARDRVGPFEIAARLVEDELQRRVPRGEVARHEVGPPLTAPDARGVSDGLGPVNVRRGARNRAGAVARAAADGIHGGALAAVTGDGLDAGDVAGALDRLLSAAVDGVAEADLRDHHVLDRVLVLTLQRIHLRQLRALHGVGGDVAVALRADG